MEWLKSARNQTLCLVSLAFIIAHADEALLPGVYREIALVLHVSPVGLGTLTMIRTLSQASFSPLAACAAVHHNRVNVITVGALLWTLATYAAGFSNTYSQIAVSRAVNRLGLALAFPAIQSLVADSIEQHERGFAFGILQSVGNVGGILGGFCAIGLAGVPEIVGVSGWRFAFHLIATISIVIGLLVYFFIVDPRQPQTRVEHKWVKGMCEDLLEVGRQAKQVLQIPSFQILVGQGIPGTVPWKALAFMPLWLELVGCSHNATAILMGLFVAGNIFGSVFGGCACDVLSVRFPNTGGIMLAQSSQLFGLMFAVVLFVILQDSPSTEVLYGGILFLFGFMTCWEAPGTNNPIFAEIVREKSRTSVFALDRFCESFTSSLTTPLVGLLAERLYGFRFTSGSGQNAVSLANAMYTASRTYPGDRDEARLASKLEDYAPLTTTSQHLQLQEVISSNGSEFDSTEFKVSEHGKVYATILSSTIHFHHSEVFTGQYSSWSMVIVYRITTTTEGVVSHSLKQTLVTRSSLREHEKRQMRQKVGP